MAHLFNSGLFFGQAAWHGLGTTLPADSPARFSIDDSIGLAGLDWHVEKQPLFLGDGGGGRPADPRMARGERVVGCLRHVVRSSAGYFLLPPLP